MGTAGQGRHELTKADLKKRSGDRRRMALSALAQALQQHANDKDVMASLTPLDLAKAWKVHPSSAYRVLERLRRVKAVARAGVGLTAEYEITHRGIDKLDWLNEQGAAREAFLKRKGRRIAANPEE